MDERQIIEDIVDAYNSKDVEKLKQYLKEGYCSIKDKKLIINKKYIDIVKKAAVYWDEQQYVRKISLNSLYGALLNAFMRFFDQRIGQSTTLTGRNITKHMCAYINQILTGKYDNVGESIVYGDTDSGYISAYRVMKDDPQYAGFDWSNVDAIIKLYDNIAAETNTTFADFLHKTFNVPEEKSVIAAGREIVASRGIFITKKRYSALVVDKEGKRKDVGNSPGEIKAMGLDLKRSDTPIKVQNFLEETLLRVLTGDTEANVIAYIKDFRKTFREWPAWEQGTPKKVNALSDYKAKISNSKNVVEYMRLNDKLLKAKTDREKAQINKELDAMKKVSVPGHVQASINWNLLRDMHHDKYSMPITDGSKIIVCKLKPNPMNMTSVAYPIDEQRLPEWFKSLPFDSDLMEETLIDSKISNLIGILETTNKWDLSKSKNSTTFDDIFEF